MERNVCHRIIVTLGTVLIGTAGSAIDYQSDIAPVLERVCIDCHGPEKQKAEIRFDELNPDFLRGGDVDTWHDSLNQINLGVLEIIETLGFKIITGDNYNKLLSGNNFTIMLDKSNTRQQPTIIADTPDIFGNIATLSLAGVSMKEYTQDASSSNLGNFTHRVRGYNCAAEGNQESHSIEKMVLNTPRYMDIIIRQRKHKVTISETTLDYHFDRLK